MLELFVPTCSICSTVEVVAANLERKSLLRLEPRVIKMQQRG